MVSRHLSLLLLTAATLCPLAAAQTTIYVSADLTTGADNGTSWANAFRGPDSLARAIASLPAGQRDIWVARGTYVPSLTPTRSSSFVIPTGRTVIGGFAGNETSVFLRDIAANPTILTGDFSNNDAPWPSTAGRSDNAYHVVRTSGSTSAITRLDGFIIRGGNADLNLPGFPSPDAVGGGLHVEAGDAVEVRNCTFERNTGLGSAAIFAGGSSLTLYDCVIRRNSATAGTAGIGVDQTSFANIYRCRIEENTCVTASGGAGIAAAGNSVSVINSLLARNTATGSGGTGLSGAIVMGRTSTSGPGSLFIRNCTIVGNTCDLQTGGVLVQGSGSQMFMYNSIVSGNTFTNSPTNPQVVPLSGTTATVMYCMVTGGYPGATNSAAAPVFVNSPAGDFRLAAGSPGIDAGDNSRLDAQQTSDLAGQNRRVDDPLVANTGLGTPPIDLGCYERQRCAADVGAAGGLPGYDGQLDNNDFIAFIDLFFAQSPLADRGRAGGVPGVDEQYDNNDFIVYINQFFEGC